MKRQALLLPKTYRALFELAVLREEVRGLADEVDKAEAERLQRKVDAIEARALQLIQTFEKRQAVPSH
jgi:hypothetical protein